ncbi:hypothetical protein F0562_011680 [Nyssa sinensis]|uniref:Uncharacterized protein n=1 Tax=Nyssa sinensis TaxID=561372 RepID=A0A5J4ZUF9_9ASTE|nr:hypothetical protein F0562_011680 [Nyssa sinensis]
MMVGWCDVNSLVKLLVSFCSVVFAPLLVLLCLSCAGMRYNEGIENISIRTLVWLQFSRLFHVLLWKYGSASSFVAWSPCYLSYAVGAAAAKQWGIVDPEVALGIWWLHCEKFPPSNGCCMIFCHFESKEDI